MARHLRTNPPPPSSLNSAGFFFVLKYQKQIFSIFILHLIFELNESYFGKYGKKKVLKVIAQPLKKKFFSAFLYTSAEY